MVQCGISCILSSVTSALAYFHVGFAVIIHNESKARKHVFKCLRDSA